MFFLEYFEFLVLLAEGQGLDAADRLDLLCDDLLIQEKVPGFFIKENVVSCFFLL